MYRYMNYAGNVHKIMLKAFLQFTYWSAHFFSLNFKKQPAGLKGLMWSEKHSHDAHNDKRCLIFGSNWICLDKKCKHVWCKALYCESHADTSTAHPWIQCASPAVLCNT